MKNLKSQKGAVTILVLVTMLFFIAFLASTYLIIANKAQSQIEITEETRRIYEGGDAEEIYNSYFGNNNLIPIYTLEQFLKIGSNENIQINEAGGKFYTFSPNSTYVLMNDFEPNKDQVDQILGLLGENGKIEENGHKVKNLTVVAVTNKPNIDGFNKDKTYFVYWEEDNNLYIPKEIKMTGTEPNNWYNYTAGTNQWANIKTTGGGNDCYWVWIPRYAYKINTGNYHTNIAGEIEIKFLRDDTNEPIDGETIDIKNESGAGNWNVHPAFTFGNKELTGIWVAKFEASSNTTFATELASYGANSNGNNNTDKVKIVPNVTSWRNITVSNIFDVCRYMTNSGSSLENTTNIDSHMMKNIEWGAIAYLSRSIYGKNEQVWNNPWAYDNTTYYSPVTGRAKKGNNPDEFLNGNGTNNYETVTDAYNTGNGPQASTTGNVYGVYDMAGGAWEYVAGYLSEVLANDSAKREHSQSLYDEDPKYKDIYAGNSLIDTENYELEANKAKYGDAVYETSLEGTEKSSWNSEYSNFPDGYFIFRRGGRASSGSYKGTFAFSRYDGYAYADVSFRPVIVSL